LAELLAFNNVLPPPNQPNKQPKPTKTQKIGESLRRCGVGDDTADLIVARFDAGEADVRR
jgi:hypothetical protein